MFNFVESTGENIVYWEGVPIGIECGDHITWFPSAPPEAIAALSKK